MNWEVIQGDCRIELEAMAAESVDLVFADPPFNFNREYGTWDDSLSESEYAEFMRGWIGGVEHVLRPGGSLWVNVPDILAVAHIKAINAVGIKLHQWCMWHYQFGQCTDHRFINSHTHALWFSKGDEKPKWRPEDIKVESVRQKMGDKRAKEGGRVPLDVWHGEGWGRVQGNNGERVKGQDNQLPERYLERVVRCCTDPGDVVVDPFTGSGTTGAVADALGRKFTGIEIDMVSCERARTRIAKGAVNVKGKVHDHV